jgi:hypothetical protein
VLRSTWLFWALLALFTILLILTAVGFTILFHGYEVARASLPLILIFCFLLAFISFLPFHAARRMYKTMISAGKPIAFRFTADGIHAHTDYSSGDTSWAVLWKVYEAKTFFCLYLDAGSAWVIPKRFFADANQQELWRSLVEAQLEPKKILKPGVVGKLL